MNNIDILEEKIKIIESLCTDDCINKETVIKPLKYAIETLIAENKELKEFKENIERIDKKQLDKLYKDAQKALKEYRETQNKVAKLEEENKELKEKNKELEEEDIKIRAKFILQLDNYIPKSKVEEVIEEVKKDENPSISSFQEYAQEYAIDKLQSLLGKE